MTVNLRLFSISVCLTSNQIKQSRGKQSITLCEQSRNRLAVIRDRYRAIAIV